MQCVHRPALTLHFVGVDGAIASMHAPRRSILIILFSFRFGTHRFYGLLNLVFGRLTSNGQTFTTIVSVTTVIDPGTVVTPTTVSTHSASKSNTGAIVGGVVGGAHSYLSLRPTGPLIP